MRLVFNKLANIFVEVISFIILIFVLVISCTLLLLTGKFSAFAFRKRKENINPETSELVEQLHYTLHAYSKKGLHLVSFGPYLAVSGGDHV